MKLGKLAAAVKTNGGLFVYHTPTLQWMGTPHAVYLAKNIPPFSGRSQAAALLGIAEIKFDAIYTEEREAENSADINGMNLENGVGVAAKEAPLPQWFSDELIMLRSENGTIAFCERRCFEPIKDEMINNSYIGLAIGHTVYGSRYVIVKNGFETIAGFLCPLVCTEDFLDSLNVFATECRAQMIADEQRRHWKELREQMKEEREEAAEEETEDTEPEE